MQSYIIALLVMLCVGACVYWMFKRNSVKKDQETGLSKNDSQIDTRKQMEISFDVLQSLTEEEESKLSEVKDNNLLAIIDGVIPGASQAIANGVTVKNYHEATEKAGELYQVIIPKGAKLDHSKSMENAFRASYRDKANRSKGNANLVKADGSSADKMAMVNTANAVMNVASMVVGQYYMAQINDQLSDINSGIERISDFQQNEYKSKVYALVAEIQKSSLFQVETVENEDLRNRELAHLKTLEHECAQLLGQANLSLQQISERHHQDYEDYEKNISQAETWIQYQHVLLEVMQKISDLTYALNLGAISRENSFALCQPYIKQSDNTLEKMKEWHKLNCTKFEVNIEESRRRRQGVEGFFMGALGWFDDDFNYKKMSKWTIDSIEHQSDSENNALPAVGEDLFQEDVRLVAREGRLYYLPGSH